MYKRNCAKDFQLQNQSKIGERSLYKSWKNETSINNKEKTTDPNPISLAKETRRLLYPLFCPNP